MNKTKEAIQSKGSITKGMYIKESKGLPVIYTPFQDIDAFCSIYCRGKDGMPLIVSTMMHDLEDEMLAEYPNNGEDLPDDERLKIKLKAGRQTQKIWNFFWGAAKKVNDEGKYPFIIRMRHWEKKDKDLSK